MQIRLDVDAVYNEHSRLRLMFPTLNKEQADDKICAKHFRKNQTSGALNKILSCVLFGTSLSEYILLNASQTRANDLDAN
jgi:hypothetical protein